MRGEKGMPDLISIVMPVYNAEDSLQNSIQSILSQTYQRWELIAVDDGSKDKSLSILTEYSKRDSRIKVIHQDNGGVSSARNTGISFSKGEYLSFIDSDDTYNNKYLETMVAYSKLNACDLVVCGYIEEKSNRCVSMKQRLYSSVSELAEDFKLLYDLYLLNTPWNKLYRRDKVVSRFPNGVSIGEDYIFNVENILNCNNILVVEECLYNYNNMAENSLANRYHPNAFEAMEKMLKVTDKLLNTNGINYDTTRTDFLTDNYFRCIYHMVRTNKLSFLKKRALFGKWEASEQIRWLHTQYENIDHKYKMIFHRGLFIEWYIRYFIVDIRKKRRKHES